MKTLLRSALALCACFILASCVNPRPKPIRYGQASSAISLVDCALATPCTLSGPANTGTGDPAYAAFGKINGDFQQIEDMFGATGLLIGNGDIPNAMTSLAPSSTGIYCLDWASSITSAPTLTNSCGSGGGGTPGGSSYSLQYNDAGSFGGILPGSTGTYCIDYTSLSAAPSLTTTDCPGSGGSSPGGSSYSAQYNNDGTLGGVLPGSAGTYCWDWSATTSAPTLTVLCEAGSIPGYATASLPTCNSAAKGSIAYTTDNTAAFVFCDGLSWIGTGGTEFTYSATGCTPSAAAGTASAGSITLASGPCTSIVITPNGAIGMTAPDGWHCTVTDRTALNGGTWIPNWGESASTTTTATIPIPGAAGSTDVITFGCTPY